MIPYVISVAIVLAFAVIWCYSVGRELRKLKKSVDHSASQVDLNRAMVANATHDTELQQADKMLTLSLAIYAETARRYNRTRSKPFHRPPSIMLGFQAVSEHI